MIKYTSLFQLTGRISITIEVTINWCQSLVLPLVLLNQKEVSSKHQNAITAISRSALLKGIFPPSIKTLNIHYKTRHSSPPPLDYLPLCFTLLWFKGHELLLSSRVLIFLLQCKCLKWKLMTPIGEPPKLLRLPQNLLLLLNLCSSLAK